MANTLTNQVLVPVSCNQDVLTSRTLVEAPWDIKIRHIANCLKAAPAYGERVAAALGLPLNKVQKQI